MSTTVNVRVDKSKLTQKLKAQSEANRFAYENGTATNLSADEKAAQKDAVAKAVAEAKKRSDSASYLKRGGLRDPIGRRDGSGIVLPNGVELLPDGLAPAEGTLVQLARVGIRWNANRTKVFVYPWGIEGALGARLSTDFATAVSQAAAVGTELSLPFPNWFGNAPAKPTGTMPLYSPNVRVPGQIYDVLPYLEVTSFNPAIYYNISGKWSRQYNGFVGFPLYDSETTTYNGSSYIHYLGDLAPGTNSYTYYTYNDLYPSARAFVDLDGSLSTITAEFVLPAGGDKALYVLIVRSIAERVLARVLYGSTFSESIISDNGFQRNTNVSIDGAYTSYTLYDDNTVVNEVLCVLVDGASTQEMEASDELRAACADLVDELDFANATGTTNTTIVNTIDFTWGAENTTTYTTLSTPAFELSNMPKAPYYDKSANEQALAKHLGLGYIETTTHTGPFYTPAVFEWLKGAATFTETYADVAPPFYTPADENNPFVGVYLSVTQYQPDLQTMRATATQPLNVTTAHTAIDWYTINTGSKWGDLLVWDWGNPEYCRQQLASLGMNV
jgi:hypothetical protein